MDREIISKTIKHPSTEEIRGAMESVERREFLSISMEVLPGRRVKSLTLQNGEETEYET